MSIQSGFKAFLAKLGLAQSVTRDVKAESTLQEWYITRVEAALADTSRFTFRSPQGLAKETGLELGIVTRVLRTSPNIRRSRGNNDVYRLRGSE
jgi:hypothetical protein